MVPLGQAASTMNALQNALAAGISRPPARIAKKLSEDLAKVRQSIADAARAQAAQSPGRAGRAQDGRGSGPLARRGGRTVSQPEDDCKDWRRSAPKLFARARRGSFGNWRRPSPRRSAMPNGPKSGRARDRRIHETGS